MQSIVRDLAQRCGGHALALTLAAGAVKTDAELLSLPEPGVAQWKRVLDDLVEQIAKQGKQRMGSYSTPLGAYAMSVERQTQQGKSVLSTLCLFPAVFKAPKEMVRAIWEAQIGAASSAAEHLEAASFEDGLEALALANIVDMHESDCGCEGVLQRYISCFVPCLHVATASLPIASGPHYLSCIRDSGRAA